MIRFAVGTIERKVLSRLESDNYGNWLKHFGEQKLLTVIERIVREVNAEQNDTTIKELEEALDEAEEELEIERLKTKAQQPSELRP